MNGSNEKKWFVYLGDHYEGPFSVEDIQYFVSQFRLTPNHYLWTQGMSDWQPMSQVPDFAGLSQQAVPPPPPLAAQMSPGRTPAPAQPVAPSESTQSMQFQTESVSEETTSVRTPEQSDGPIEMPTLATKEDVTQGGMEIDRLTQNQRESIEETGTAEPAQESGNEETQDSFSEPIDFAPAESPIEFSSAQEAHREIKPPAVEPESGTSLDDVITSSKREFQESQSGREDQSQSPGISFEPASASESEPSSEPPSESDFADLGYDLDGESEPEAPPVETSPEELSEAPSEAAPTDAEISISAQSQSLEDLSSEDKTGDLNPSDLEKINQIATQGDEPKFSFKDKIKNKLQDKLKFKFPLPDVKEKITSFKAKFSFKKKSKDVPALTSEPASEENVDSADIQASQTDGDLLQEKPKKKRFAVPKLNLAGLTALLKKKKKSPPAVKEALPPQIPISEAEKTLSRAIEGDRKRSKIVKKMSYAAAVGLLLGAAGVGYQQGYLNPILHNLKSSPMILKAQSWAKSQVLTLSKSVPFLEKWASPLPNLEGLTPKDKEHIVKISKADVSKHGARFSIAMRQGNKSAPVFYIVSNMPDGTRVRLHISGIPETLLNRVGFYQSQELTIQNHFAQSAPIRNQDGSDLFRGKYGLYITAEGNQDAEIQRLFSVTKPLRGRKPAQIQRQPVFGYRSFFLGGKNDQVYQQRLEEFHQKLRQRAKQELSEVSQFAMTLKSQFDSTQKTFEELSQKKISNETKKKKWDQFHKGWAQLQDHIVGIVGTWTSDVLSDEYYYGTLYYLVQQAGLSIQKVHEFHHAYFADDAQKEEFKIQLGEAKSSAESALALLEAKKDKIEKLSNVEKGIPRRETP